MNDQLDRIEAKLDSITDDAKALTELLSDPSWPTASELWATLSYIYEGSLLGDGTLIIDEHRLDTAMSKLKRAATGDPQ